MVASKVQVQAQINGDEVEFLCEPRQSLLEVLRDTLWLTGTKEGCNNGNCGACNVIMDGVLVNSCLVLGVEVQGKTITTIEGVGHNGQLHPIQQQYLAHAALQCGICTPGLIVATKALLEHNPSQPSMKYACGWQATSAAAPVTTKSSAQYSMLLSLCGR